jgi:hypothetical protein
MAYIVVNEPGIAATQQTFLALHQFLPIMLCVGRSSPSLLHPPPLVEFSAARKKLRFFLAGEICSTVFDTWVLVQ